VRDSEDWPIQRSWADAVNGIEAGTSAAEAAIHHKAQGYLRLRGCKLGTQRDGGIQAADDIEAVDKSECRWAPGSSQPPWAPYSPECEKTSTESPIVSPARPAYATVWGPWVHVWCYKHQGGLAIPESLHCTPSVLHGNVPRCAYMCLVFVRGTKQGRGW